MSFRFTAPTCALLFVCTTAAAQSPRHDPDSISTVLDIELSTRFEELSAQNVQDYRLYFDSSRVLLIMRAGDKRYQYVLEGERSMERGLALLEALRQGGVERFVVKRDGERRAGFTEVR